MKTGKCSYCGYVGFCYETKVSNFRTYFLKVIKLYCAFCFFKIKILKKK